MSTKGLPREVGPPVIAIAFGSKARVGKDTAAEYIKNRFGGQILKFSDSLYNIVGNIQVQLGKPVKKDPKLLQFIGMGIREHYGNNIWVDNLVENLESTLQSQPRSIIISDMRFPNEYEKLNSLGFLCLKVSRENRPIDRDPNHPSEIGLDNTQLDTLDNNFHVNHLYLQINNEIYTHFLASLSGVKFVMKIAVCITINNSSGVECCNFNYVEFGDTRTNTMTAMYNSLHKIMFNEEMDESSKLNLMNFNDCDVIKFNMSNFIKFVQDMYEKNKTIEIYNNYSYNSDNNDNIETALQFIDIKIVDIS